MNEIIVIAIVVAFVSNFVVWAYASIMRSAKKRAESEVARLRGLVATRDRQIEIERDEIERLRIEMQKQETIRNEQIKQRDKISTGDPAADFAGSIDVLSDLSAKRRTDRGH
jgi:hypothetical protein